MKYMLYGMFLMASMMPIKAKETEREMISFANADQVAKHLRSEYGVAKAVYLTQLAHQLSGSFASTEQLQQQWQQALETEIAEPLNFTQINTHALMAQSLIQYTNGMSLNRWRQINIPATYGFRTLDHSHVSSATFNTWLSLNSHWQNLLNEKHENIKLWNPWVTNISVTDNDDPENTDSIAAVLALVTKEEEITADIVSQLNEEVAEFDPIAIALMRQQYHSGNQQLLALAYDWIEIYQLLELSPQLLTADQQISLASELEQTTINWQAQQNEIDQINNKLYNLLNKIFTALPSKFKNPDHFDENLNNDIFSFITGIQNPKAYFSHPLRQEIQENLEVCLNLSVQQRPEPPVPIADNQFDSCVTDFINWGSTWSKSADFAGNLIRLDNPASINRAIELPAVQIINNLAIQAAGDISCQQQLSTRSNWVEWSMAAEVIAWFNDRWPALMAEQQTEDLLKPIFDSGMEIFNYADCVNTSTPLTNQYQVVLNKWELLKQEIITHVNQFKATRLSANSDVDLFKSIDQATNYVPEELSIGPCDVTQSCGAYIKLEPNRELLNLFPNHLKLAEQLGLGKLEICYQEVQWVNRKTAPTHLDNNKIANFAGQLALQLTGKYQGDNVFTKQFFSEHNHIYLFGENNEEVLNTACPLPLVGKQINTTLDRGTYGLLPNRLTFLTAAKVDINAVIQSNWTNWLAQLNNNPNDFAYFDEMNTVKTALNDAFLHLVNNLQQEIYRKLIANNPSRSNDSALSKATFEFITHRKLLERMVNGLYPQLMASNPKLHAAINGTNRLVDMQFFRQAFQNQVNIVDMLNSADENFTKHQNIWTTSEFNEPIIHSTLDQLHSIQSQQIVDIKKDDSGD